MSHTTKNIGIGMASAKIVGARKSGNGIGKMLFQFINQDV